MDRTGYYIAIILSFILFSCGQVGIITGGQVDDKAPKPILSQIDPPIASLNTAPDKIIIPFDEFIALNKPAQNISVTPKDVTIDYSISGKSLLLERKEGKWKENTTYSVSLNRAVKDITEGNDSIMLYVFSTGPYIDSLSCSFYVMDAYSRKSLNEIEVGLFLDPLLNDTSDVRPRYLSSTDKNGKANFQYLKDSNYYAYAFNDENKNSRLDPTEKRGRLRLPIQPVTSDSVLDTLYLMPPVIDEVRVLSNEFISPGLWSIGFNKTITETDSIQYLGNNLLSFTWNDQRDSLTFYLMNQLSGSASFILKGKTSDTITKRFFFKEDPELTFTNNLKSNRLQFGDTLMLTFNDAIERLDTGNISCFLTIDSTKRAIHPSFEIIDGNKLKVYGFDRSASKQINLDFLPNSIIGYNLSNKDSLELVATIGLKKDLGSLIIELDTTILNSVLIISNDKGEEVARKVLDNNKKVLFENLSPGKYRYSILLDENKNGQWDTGNIFSGVESEKVLWFEKSSIVRANWDVESSLDIRSKLK